MRRRTFLQHDQFVTAFAEAKEKGQQKRVDQQPLGRRHSDSHRPGIRPEHKTDGDTHDIDNDNVLEPDRVEEIEKQKSRGYQKEIQIHKISDAESRQTEYDNYNRRAVRADLAGGQRPESFYGVLPVLLKIKYVVEYISGRREKTEDGGGEKCQFHAIRMGCFPGKYQRRQQNAVLQPLCRTNQPDNRAKHTKQYNINHAGTSINWSTTARQAESPGPGLTYLPFLQFGNFLYCLPMIRKRTQKNQTSHYGILVNKTSAGYNPRVLKRLVTAIRNAGEYYTVFEPETADELYQTGLRMCGLKRWHRGAPGFFEKRGPVTGLVAIGGDGTFNIVGEVAMRADIPVGIIPTGRSNSIARSLYADDDPDVAIARIIDRKSRKHDVAFAHGRPFFDSLGLGFMVELTKTLAAGKRPRFGIGWSQLGLRAASEVQPQPVVIKIDSFRFEFTPIMLNFSILPYSSGLPFTPVSSPTDGYIEVMFDLGQDPKLFAQFLRQVYKKKYLYGADVKLFRGKAISLQVPKGTAISLDGEIVHTPVELLDITIEREKLKVFC